MKRALILLSVLLPMSVNALPKDAQGDARPGIEIHEDLNAVRRARYAVRQTKEGTPEREAAEKRLREAKEKLKDDRLKRRKK